jgi:hypothetical protein
VAREYGLMSLLRNKIVASIGLLMALSFLVNSSDALLVGVKKGDWIEYAVRYTGALPEGYNAVSWSLDILDVKGAEIKVNLTAFVPNGAPYNNVQTLNLENGSLGVEELLVIPANLKDGDTFFDKDVGNITIEGTENRIYAGKTRTVVIYSSKFSTRYWDQSSGVLLEGILTFPDFSMASKVDKTNLWQPQPTVDYTALVAIAFAAAIIIAIAIFLVAQSRKKMKQKSGSL